MTLNADMTMRELLDACPGAQRAMFRHFHIGGCASCGFAPEEKLSEVCARNEGVSPQDVIDRVLEAHQQDEKVLMHPAEAAEAVRDRGAKLLDIRTREEFEAVRIEGALLFSQDTLQNIMGTWPKDAFLIVCDHTGTRSLDAAAYFAGHGFQNVRALRGGIDAWSTEVDPSIPRYSIE